MLAAAAPRSLFSGVRLSGRESWPDALGVDGALHLAGLGSAGGNSCLYGFRLPPLTCWDRQLIHPDDHLFRIARARRLKASISGAISQVKPWGPKPFVSPLVEE